jgi:hypothetical protein
MQKEFIRYGLVPDEFEHPSSKTWPLQLDLKREIIIFSETAKPVVIKF